MSEIGKIVARLATTPAPNARPALERVRIALERAIEHEGAIAARREELEKLAHAVLVERAQRQALPVDPRRYVLVDELAHHEVAQELLVRWAEEDEENP